jgi:two-component system KDP operon response regulator KdpE
VVVEGFSRRLTRREAAMLRVLNAAKGAVVSHKDLVGGIWGAESDADVMHLRVLAWQVRRKIEPDPSNPRYLIAAGPGLPAEQERRTLRRGEAGRVRPSPAPPAARP